MARYIDADAFKELITEHIQDKEAAYWLCVLIDEQPTANVAPIADTVREMQERLRFKIVNTPSDFNSNQSLQRTVDFLNGSSYRQHKILDILDQIAEEMIEKGD